MKRVSTTTSAMIGALVVSLAAGGAAARAQRAATRPAATTTRPVPADRYAFELTPVAPPSPALKYQLLFDDLADRRPGDAVPLYFDAALLLGPELKATFEKAEDALLDDHDVKKFAALMDSANKPELFEQLELAARRERCDWDPPFREMGVRTLLPHLNACRSLGQAIKLRATRQIQQGKVEEALATLRLGYEMADKVSREPVLVSGLVSIGLIAYFDDALAELMSRPESPNLYWALCEFPARKPTFRLDCDRLGSATSTLPALARARAGEEVSAEQWRAAMEYVAGLTREEDKEASPVPDPVRDTSAEVLREARAYYARARHVPAGEAERVDPAVVLGVYYFHEYEDAYDGYYKLRNLPYPIARRMSSAYAEEVKRRVAAQPANPFLRRLPRADLALETYARVDRNLAALTAVEAIRSYAAGHGGALPKALADVTETPVPIDPMTGRPFDYRVEGEAATLSGADEDYPGRASNRYPLIYTIRIRK